MEWNSLKASDKSKIIRTAVEHGITDLEEVKSLWRQSMEQPEMYDDGGILYDKGTQSPDNPPMGRANPDNWKEYMDWAYAASERLSREWDEPESFIFFDMLNNNDYDYKAFYDEDPERAWQWLESPEGSHFDDVGKTVYHPSFSNESMYSANNYGDMGTGANPDNIEGPAWNDNNQLIDKEGNVVFDENVYAEGGPLKEFFRKIISKDARKAPEYNGVSFSDAYKDAREKGVNTFYHNGNYYSTKGYLDRNTVSMDKSGSFGDAYKKARLGQYESFNYKGDTYYAPEMSVSERYKALTGNDWKNAKTIGFTDGSYEKNIILDKVLKNFTDEYDITDIDIAKAYARMLDDKFYQKFDDRSMMRINPDKGFITLTGGGKNAGTKISVDLLDKITDYAERNNIPLNIAYGLPAQESAFGKNEFSSYDPVYSENVVDLMGMYSGWDMYDNPARSYIGAANENGNWIGGFKPMLKEYESFKSKIEDGFFDWAYDKYLNGTYNRKDPRHSEMVEKRGNDFLNSPEIKKYLNNRKKRNNDKHMSGGKLFKIN